jgi:hypothetical protein
MYTGSKRVYSIKSAYCWHFEWIFVVEYSCKQDGEFENDQPENGQLSHTKFAFSDYL